LGIIHWEKDEEEPFDGLRIFKKRKSPAEWRLDGRGRSAFAAKPQRRDALLGILQAESSW
jgi:hypothetical protein